MASVPDELWLGTTKGLASVEIFTNRGKAESWLKDTNPHKMECTIHRVKVDVIESFQTVVLIKHWNGDGSDE